jgi:hypothetical protein
MIGQEFNRDAKAIFLAEIKKLENDKKDLMNEIVALMLKEKITKEQIVAQQ